MPKKSAKAVRRSMSAKHAASCRHRYKMISPDKLRDDLEDNESEPPPIVDDQDIDLDFKIVPDEISTPDNLVEDGISNQYQSGTGHNNNPQAVAEIETTLTPLLALIKSLLDLIVKGKKPPEPVASIVDLLNYLETRGTIIITEDDEDRIRSNIYGFYSGYQAEIKEELEDEDRTIPGDEEYHSTSKNDANEKLGLMKSQIPKLIISSQKRLSSSTNNRKNQEVDLTRLPYINDEDSELELPLSVTKEPNPKVYCLMHKRPTQSQRQLPVTNRLTEKADGKLNQISDFLNRIKEPRKVFKIVAKEKQAVLGGKAGSSEVVRNLVSQSSTRPSDNFPEGIRNAKVVNLTMEGVKVIQDFSAEVASGVESLPSTSTTGIENPRLPTPDSTIPFPRPPRPSFYRRKILNMQGVKIMKKSKILQYKCGQCGKVFMGKERARRLKSHMTSHLNLRNHLCQTCGKTFKTERCLTVHNLIHGGEKKYLCDKCPMAFLRSNALVRHQMTHTGVKTVVCPVCGIKFLDNRRLKCHSVIHSEERPFKCTFCPKTFRRPEHLRAHTRIHTGVHPYKCEPCGKSWVQIGSLIFHNRTHHGIVKEKNN